MVNEYLIALENTNIIYTCSEEQTILGGMEKLGLKGVPVGCRGGGCGVCKVHITEGSFTTKKMSRAHISKDEQAKGYVLACRCIPSSNLKLKVIGKMKNGICSH